jgi:hypothetical protein
MLDQLRKRAAKRADQLAGWLNETSTRVLTGIEEARKTLSETLVLEVDDDLKSLKKRLNELAARDEAEAASTRSSGQK